MSYKEQKELDALPDQIAALESEQADLGEKLSDPSIFSDAAQVKNIQQRLQVVEHEIDAGMVRWAELEDK